MTPVIETTEKYSLRKWILTGFIEYFRTIGIAILSAACFGVTVVTTKQSLNDLSPLTVLVIQGISSIIFLWLLIAYLHVELPKKSIAWKASLIGFLEPGLAYIFSTFGLKLTTASNATLISVSEPIITIALAAILLKENISSPLIYLALIACAGVALVASPDIAQITVSSLTGDTLVLLGVLCASLYAIVNRRLVHQVAPLSLVALQQSFALVWFVLILGLSQLFGDSTESIFNNFAGANLNSLFLAIVSGIVGQGLAFWLYLMALRASGVSITSLYLTLIPLFGVATAYFVLGERLSFIQTVGGGLILIVVLFVSQLPEVKS